jgi:PAS domain S-box-containing protein
VPAAALLDRGWTDVLHRSDAGWVIDAWLEATTTVTPFRREFRMRDSEGEYRWVIMHAVPSLGAHDEVTCWYGTVVPIDERRNAEHALAMLADSIPQLVWASDPDGNAVHVNRRWLEYTGASLEDSLGAGWAHALHPDDAAEAIARWTAAAETGALGPERPYRLRRHDGVYRWFVVRAVAVRDENGAIFRWYGTGTDVDGEYRAAQRRAMLDRLGLAFAESLEYERTARTVVSAVCEDFADFAFVDAFDAEGRLERIAVDAGRLSPDAERFRGFAPPPEARSHPINVVLSTGKPMIVAQCDDAWLRATTWSEQHFAFASSLPLASIVYVPMIAAGERIGVLTFGAAAGTGRSFSQADLADAQEVARRAAVALANARLYRDLTASEARYRGIIDTAQEGVWIVDRDHRTRYVNARLTEILGYEPDEMYERRIFDFIEPSEREEVRRALALHQAGDGYRGELRMLHKDGRAVWAMVASNPLFDAAGAFAGSLGMFTDVTERKAIEKQHRLLADAGEILAASLDVERTLPALAELAAGCCADVCLIHLRDRNGKPRLVAAWHADAARHATVADDASILRRDIALVIATGDAVFAPQLDGERWAKLDARSMIVAPLIARGIVLGAITLLAATNSRPLGLDEVRLAELLAKRAAVTVDNARLYGEERRLARMREIVARASDVLTSSLDLGVLLGRFADVLIAELADEVTIVLDPDRAVVRRRAELDAGAPSTRVLLRHRSVELGSLTLRGRSAFSPDDALLLEELAARASVAIENAQLYEREHRVAVTLQRAMLPAILPAVEGLTFDAVYFPGATDAEIGGDWYDAIALPDGRVVVSIGDVTGRGLTAAVIMGRMRQAIETLATYESDPGRLLDAADNVLRRAHPDAIVTALVGVVDPVTCTFAYATAGHPTPIVRTPDGTTRQLPGRGLPLGLRDGYQPAAASVVLPPASLVVFFTDGLVESTRDIAEGERRVFAALHDRAVAESATPAASLVARVLDDGVRDDVAVLTMRVSGAPAAAAGWTLRWRFDPREARATYEVRDALVEALASFGHDVDVQAAELVFGELVGNAMRYAHGAIDVEVSWEDPAAPVLSVVDDGPGYAARTVRPSHDAESGRGLFLISQLTREFTVTALHDRGAQSRAVLIARA